MHVLFHVTECVRVGDETTARATCQADEWQGISKRKTNEELSEKSRTNWNFDLKGSFSNDFSTSTDQ